ncbi:MAG TPA: 30S ribosomal protein S4, partial [Dehalococcoidales bacterium]
KGSRCFTPKCAIDKRPKPPGQQPARRRRFSDRGLQLREKQKARYTYGTLERQFKKVFLRAEKQSGITGENLMVLLERRLDNVVYRLGFADSRPQARQLVRHGHIMLNGHRTDIPSCLVKEGDTISWREGSQKNEYYKQLTQTIESKTVLNWLSLDRQNLVGQVLSLPTTGDIDAKFDGKAIVEYYSR